MDKPTSVAAQRFASYVVDSLVISLAIVIFWLLLTDKVPKEGIDPSSGGIDIGDKRYAFTEENSGNRALWVILSIATALVVSVVLPALKGISPGRALAGIRLVKEDGRPPGLGRAAGRWVLWIVDQFPWFIPLVGPICVLATDKNQRVGDMATGTYTVKKELAGQPLQFPQAGGFVQPVFAGAQAGPGAQGGQGAGWHPDPHGQARLRWWDGSRWTEHTSN
jgi:uncharacterized RDD family membrane protein YckC